MGSTPEPPVSPLEDPFSDSDNEQETTETSDLPLLKRNRNVSPAKPDQEVEIAQLKAQLAWFEASKGVGAHRPPRSFGPPRALMGYDEYQFGYPHGTSGYPPYQQHQYSHGGYNQGGDFTTRRVIHLGSCLVRSFHKRLININMNVLV